MAKFVSMLDLLRADWDRRAQADAFGAACPALSQASTDAFLRSGQELFETEIAPALAALDRPPGTELRALDLGCGPGRLLLPLATACAEVHGVDVSPVMLRRAGEVLGDAERIRLHLNDGMTLRCVRRMAFDLIVSHDTLSHLPDAGLIVYLLRQATLRLAPGGLLLAHFAAGHAIAESDLASLFARAGLSAETRRAGTSLWFSVQSPLAKSAR
jgi:SAM-dependent methyltransferase